MNARADSHVLVVVPAYNAATHLPELIPRLRRVIDNQHLLIVNDGSTDNTPQLLHDLHVNHISFPHNRGKGAALAAGFEYAMQHGYSSVLTLDADLQHLPEEIPGLLRSDDGRRIVIGTRRMDLRVMPLSRWLTNNLTSMIVSVFSRCRVRDSQCGFRLVPTSLLRHIPLQSRNYDFESELLLKAGALRARVAEVPISTIYEDSRSFINPLRDTWRFVRQIWKRIWM